MAEPIHTYDDVIAEKIKYECHSADTEIDHCRADEILTQLLIELGYRKTVSAWEEVAKWYA